MIIKDVKLSREGETTTLSAKCKIRKVGWDTVYFKLTSPQSDYTYADASPFACALLVASMRQGEDLIVHGRMSKQLHSGMLKIMDEMLTWNIDLSKIAIKADTLVQDDANPAPTKTGSFFSGGVDSFYTYLKHKTDAAGAGRIDSLILVNGFDIDLRSHTLWDLTQRNIAEVAEAEGVELVTVESNIQKLVEPIVSWDFVHGGCLAAVGLFLRTAFGHIYIPSTFTVDEQVPWGSHLKLDHLWSTERIKFVHDGVEASRLNKVIWQVAQSDTALNYLRVCYDNQIGAYNCGRCPKCMRTMTSLYIAGTLDKAVTFPHELDIQLIAETPEPINDGEQIFAGPLQHVNSLREQGRAPDLQQAIKSSMAKTMEIREGANFAREQRRRRLITKVMYLDHVYLRGLTYTILSHRFGRRFA